MRKPVLSICIPTYNRSIYLKRLLDKIFDLPNEILKNIEVCISNNNSKDDTENVVENYIEKINLKYKCNSTNIGSSYNYLQAMKMASGHYIWVMGDDDVIENKNFILFFQNELIELKKRTWFILGSLDENNNKQYNYSTIFKFHKKFNLNINNLLLLFGLHPFGLISMHIYSRDCILFNEQLKKFDYKIMQWTHMILWLARAKTTKYEFKDSYLIKQLGDGLVWNPSNYLTVQINRLYIVDHAEFSDFFKFILGLRIIFSKSLIINAFLCKIVTNDLHSVISNRVRNLKNTINSPAIKIVINFIYYLYIIDFIPLFFYKLMPAYSRISTKYSTASVGSNNEGFAREF